MRKKICWLLTSVMLLSAIMLGGCGAKTEKLTAEGILEQVNTNMEKVRSVSGDMAMDMDMKISQSGLGMNLTAGLDCDLEMTMEPEVLHMSGKLDMSLLGLSMDIETYSVIEGDKAITYTKANNAWTQTEEAAEDSEIGGMGDLFDSLSSETGLTLQEGTEKLGDKDSAVSYYREALGQEKEGSRSAGFEEALIAAGSACVNGQDFDTAKSLYEEALNSGKTGEKLESRIYNQLGLCQMVEEDYNTAADSFDKGYNALITGYKAGTGAELDQAAAAVPQEDIQGMTLLKELAYNKAVCLEYSGQYRAAQAEFEHYISVFGADENAQHEIDFLKTRQEES